MHIKGFEYKIVIITAENCRTVPTISIDKLKELGDTGWELVTVTMVRLEFTSGQHVAHYYFKKEVT